MATASLAPSHSPQTPTAASALTALSTDALGDRIAAMAARLNAATYELLVLLREFDARTDWHGGFASSAHWLHWRTGIDLGAAREKVRVAHALARLPRLSATMARGAISYAKVRAIPGSRYPLPVSWLHRPPLRRASRAALGRRRRHQSRQSRAPVPPASSRCARGQVRSAARRGR
jgi:hypothetical protein